MSNTKHPDARHEHGCKHCVFLGAAGDFDLYFHDGGDIPEYTTVIARFGPDGDYYSGLCFSKTNPLLREARERAIERGFGEAIKKAGEQP